MTQVIKELMCVRACVCVCVHTHIENTKQKQIFKPSNQSFNTYPNIPKAEYQDLTFYIFISSLFLPLYIKRIKTVLIIESLCCIFSRMLIRVLGKKVITEKSWLEPSLACLFLLSFFFFLSIIVSQSSQCVEYVEKLKFLFSTQFTVL